MATPINTFKTYTAELTALGGTVYTTPAGVTAIILMAQLSNVTSSATDATVAHVSGATTTELVKDFAIPANDSASAITGKLVVEEGDSVFASAGTGSAIKLVLSVLETRNV